MKIAYDNLAFKLRQQGGVYRYFSELIPRMNNYKDAKITLLNGLAGKFFRLNSLIFDLKITPGRFEIYHPSYYSPAVKRRRGTKTVVTVYDMIHELYLQGLDNFKNDIVLKKKSILSADHIICISGSTSNDLKRIYGIDEKMISVIYLGVSIEKQADGMQDSALAEDKEFILYVGKRDNYKNFMALVDAFSYLRLKNDFYLICFGGGEFTREEISKFDRLGLSGSLKYRHGPDELLWMYYRNAKMLVYPSLYEGFGLPVIEAMASGCPVVASDAPAISEISGNAASLFSLSSAESLHSCIKQFIQDDNLRQMYIERGIERSARFSWDNTVEETYRVYKSLAS